MSEQKFYYGWLVPIAMALFLLGGGCYKLGKHDADRWYAEHWNACWKWTEEQPPFPIPDANGWNFKCYWLRDDGKVSIEAPKEKH